MVSYFLSTTSGSLIDDDKRPVTRLVSNLRRADTGNALGVIEIDDSIVQLDMVEKYDVSKFNTTFSFDKLLRLFHFTVVFHRNGETLKQEIIRMVVPELKSPTVKRSTKYYCGR